MSRCRQVLTTLALLDQELTGGALDDARRHVQTCAFCRALVENVQREGTATRIVYDDWIDVPLTPADHGGWRVHECRTARDPLPNQRTYRFRPFDVHVHETNTLEPQLLLESDQVEEIRLSYVLDPDPGHMDAHQPSYHDGELDFLDASGVSHLHLALGTTDSLALWLGWQSQLAELWQLRSTRRAR